jgi:hypothetical protein
MKPHTGTGDTIKYGDLLDRVAERIVGVEEGPLGLNYNEAESGPLKLPVGDAAVEFLGYGDTVRARITVDDMGRFKLSVRPKNIFSRDRRTFVFSPDIEEGSRDYAVHEVIEDKSLEQNQSRVTNAVPPDVAAGLFETLKAAA